MNAFLPTQNRFESFVAISWKDRKAAVYSKLEAKGYNSLTEKEIDILEEAEGELHPIVGSLNCTEI
jgi:hypothetical protein